MPVVIERAGGNIDAGNHFFYGELSRSFWGRISTNVYNSSAKEINNFIIYPSGAIRKRLGTQYVYSSTTEDLFTIDGKEVDLIFRRNTTSLGIDYAIFKDGVKIYGWQVTTEINWDELSKINLISPDGDEIFFTLKSGIFKINKTSGVLTKTPIAYKPGSGSAEPTDFTHSTIFDNSLIIIENNVISVSGLGSIYDFDFSKTGVNAPYQQTNDILKEMGAKVTNIRPYKDILIVTTTAGIFGISSIKVNGTFRILKLYFIGTQVVAPQCIINQNSHMYFCTNSGLWTFSSSLNISQESNVVAGVDNFETVLLSSYCGHVFDVPIIQLSKRKRDYPSIIYGLREDGAIINFTIHPRQLTETNLRTIAISRRTCDGEYTQMSHGFFSTCVSKRIDRNNSSTQFVEKEIFNSFINDNRIQRKIEDSFLMKNRSYYDCSVVNDGYIDDVGIISTNMTAITIKFPNHTYVAGQKIEVDAKEIREIHSAISSGEVVTITLTVPLKLENPTKVDGDEVFIDGFLQSKSDQNIFDVIKNYNNSGYSYIMMGQIYTHSIKTDTENNNTGNKGIHTALGIGFDAFVRMVPSSSYFEKTMPLSADIVTADTSWLKFGILEENTNKIFYRTTHVDIKTGLHGVDIPAFGDQQNMNYEYIISAKNGYEAVIMAVNYENIQQNLRDY